MTLKKAKLILWFTRIWPILMLITWLGLVITSKGQHWANDPNELPLRLILMLVVLPPYLALIYFFLPPLIYPKIPDTWNWRLAWLFFAGLTAGIGPLFLYWKRVDPWLAAWIKTEEWKEVSNQRVEAIGGPRPPQPHA